MRTGSPRSTDSPDLSLDAAADSGAHCDLLYGVLLCSALESSVTGVGTSDERGVDATAAECVQFSVLVKSGTDEKYAIRSRVSAQAKRVYRNVSSSWNKSPFRLMANNGVKVGRVR